MVNEDKTFELVEKLYIEMQTGFKKVDKRFEDVDAKMENGFQKVNGHIVRLENKLDANLKVLFDGQQQLNDKVDRIEGTVQDISNRLDKQEVEIKVIRAVK